MRTTSKESGNIYKTGRKSAGMTQEAAAAMLGVAARTLSDYENGRARVPDDVAESMSVLYKSPMLAWAHVRQASAFGKHMPRIAVPQGNGDMAFQMVLAHDGLGAPVSAVKRIMEDGEVSAGEREEFRQAMDAVRSVIARLLAVVIHAGAGKAGDGRKDQGAAA